MFLLLLHGQKQWNDDDDKNLESIDKKSKTKQKIRIINNQANIQVYN